jgi:hypothetical protein
MIKSERLTLKHWWYSDNDGRYTGGEYQAEILSFNFWVHAELPGNINMAGITYKKNH